MKFLSPLLGLAAAATLFLGSSPVFAVPVESSEISNGNVQDTTAFNKLVRREEDICCDIKNKMECHGNLCVDQKVTFEANCQDGSGRVEKIKGHWDETYGGCIAGCDTYYMSDEGNMGLQMVKGDMKFSVKNNRRECHLNNSGTQIGTQSVCCND
ncbi:hypothetical protein O0I10_000641 [Lichtheimia ornata]|uniref:Uncharacterized protein n=1 Tax=Lichtheimia ornata TaxID=688661 RepID=A0AAD7Y439_9FUNG|nr:uncharacterized protein O0I10_000641 [Lichtheimia ornata]KAJ8663402.1 hypothetical protein O0I10_000641 [Lichtheimia ornata]